MTKTAEAKELELAWYDYCIMNRLIAYGEVPELTEEQIEAHCKEQFEKDCEDIRRKYALSHSKPRKFPERRSSS